MNTSIWKLKPLKKSAKTQRKPHFLVFFTVVSWGFDFEIYEFIKNVFFAEHLRQVKCLLLGRGDFFKSSGFMNFQIFPNVEYFFCRLFQSWGKFGN